MATGAPGRETVRGGRRRGARAPRAGLLRRALVLIAAVLASGVAWVFLVVMAIDLGRASRDGAGTSGWVLTGVAGLGAALCLTLVFVLLARLMAVLRSRGRRPRGRHV